MAGRLSTLVETCPPLLCYVITFNDMQLPIGMNVYWASTDHAVVGLDSRTGVVLNGLNRDEAQLVELLERPTTVTEFVEQGENAGISKSRSEEILTMLRDEKLLCAHELREYDQQALWRTRGRIHSRGDQSVGIYRADHLGVEIALALAKAGVGCIGCADTSHVGSADHPLLQRKGFGLPRHQILTTELRALNPKIRIPQIRPPYGKTDTVCDFLTTFQPDVVVLSGYHALDPFASRAILSNGIPVFHACIEEYDIVVGPFSLPDQGTCAQCLYLHRLDAAPEWKHLGPQAIQGRAVPPHSAACSLGASFAARDILAFLDREEILLQHSAWIIEPTNAHPELRPLPVHPDCGCCAVIA